MGTTKQTFVGDPSGLQQAYRQLAQEHTRLEQQVQKLSTLSHNSNQRGIQGGNEMNQMLGAQVMNLATAAAGWISITKGIDAAITSFREWEQLNQDAANTQISLASSQAGLAINVLDKKDFKTINDAIPQIAKDTGFPDVAKLTEAASGTISASQGDLKLAIDSLRSAALLTRQRPELLGMVSSGALDIATTARGVSIDEAQALALSTGKVMRVDDPALQMKATSGAIARMASSTKEGADARSAAEGAAELMGAFNSWIKDPTGEVSRTSSVSLGTQLDEFFEKGFKQSIPGRRPITVRPQSDPGDARSRMEFLSRPENENMRRTFFDNAHFEAGFGNVWKNFATRGTAENELLGKSSGEIGYDTQIVKDLRHSLDSATPQLILANARREAEGSTQRLENISTPQGVEAESRRILFESLAKTRGQSEVPLAGAIEPWLAEGVYQGKRYSGTAAPDAAIEILRDRITEINDEGGARKRESELTPAERQSRDFLQQQIATLQKLAEQQLKAAQDQTAAIQEMNERARDEATRRPSASPAVQAEAGRHRER